MVLITPDEGPSGLTTSVTSLERQLSDMRADLEALQDRIRAGEFEGLKNPSRAISDIRQWLRIAIEAEAQIERRQKEQKGIVHEWALDFDTARTSIGSRLDRLRRARSAGRVP
ncbi:hypothetical protein DQW77_05075 [Roseovarius sp. TE539]|uniref:hypothetical protein n=1 Tax=Roseovarius sp. TE539 TaxID=2249812 RepID=UPI000DDC7333|nr:hypothetical protein [Roseovarius sp. TE539]RBI75738.1 hypothetical protein DQW77_05075 [Roseovarius sp. TE539]